MAAYVLDTFALVAFFRAEDGADEIEKLLVDASQGKHQLYLCSYNAGEIYYAIWRKNGKAMADVCRRNILQFHVTIIEADLQLTFEAAAIKATHRLSYADAHAAALALHLDATLVTGDKEFNNLKDIKGFRVKQLL
ncbi:MAG TPA: type II toxin-antitoxin system VapC family toxin [Chitinophagaceae bacterium]|nr:type II toxin-antitoxin system VapC family toxin [Chitinophagaceae bacterium]